MFDLDMLAEEIGATHGQDAIDGMHDDAERIRDRMESRRKIMEQQIASDSIKSKLCDKIQSIKREVPNLTQKIAAFEDSDPELFKYIRTLEFINKGIWCPKCDVMKSIGSRPESTIAQSHTSSDIDVIRDEYNVLARGLEAALDDVDVLRGVFDEKCKQLTEAVRGLQVNLVERLQELDENPSIDISAARDHFTHVMNDRVSTVSRSVLPSINTTVKKEDLPTRPEFDLDKLIEEKFKAISSTDLLL